MTPDDPTRTLAPERPDGPTGTFDPALDAALAAAFGPDPTPGGWSRPPLLRDEPSDHAPLVQPSSPEMPRGPADRYQLLGEIARGGMGVILKGRDPDLGRDLAFKVLKAELAGRPAAEQRFVEEAQVGGQLQHPGVVPVYDLGRFADGRPYFAMKLVKGRTLADLLADRANPGEDHGRFLQIFLQVCQTVAYAHSRGVIHRDLKPANVMVGGFGEVLVMDWGLAKVLPRGGVADEDRATRASRERGRPEPEPTVIHTARSGSRGGSETGAGSVLGTPAFMPPEQAGGEVDKLDERADVFGLGAVLCVLLTGRPPYVADMGEAVRLMAVRGQLAECSARLDGCGADAELVGLARRCLAADRDARPRHAGEVAAALAAHLAGVEDRARRAEMDRAAAEVRTREERKRRRVQMALAVSVGMLLLGGGAFGWWQDRQAERAGRARAEFAAEQARLEGQRAAAEARTRAGVGAALVLAADLRAKYRFAEAEAALGQAEGLIPADGPADLRDRLRRAADDLAFARELDAIRTRRSTWIHEDGGRFDAASAPPAYRAAFLARGLDVAGGDAGAVAGRVRGSAIRADLVAALDDWAALEPDAGVRDRVLAAVRLADPGPWLDRFRDPGVRGDRPKVEALVAGADPAALAPGTVTALATLMERHGLDPTRVLLAAQFAHPTDFEVPFALGQWWLHAKGCGEAITHYRAARVARPDNRALLNNLGIALREKGDVDGALACYREAVRLAPMFAPAHFNLGVALAGRKDYAGAVACYREAVRLAPKYAPAHYNLGVALQKKGDVGGAVACYREAVRLAPMFAPAHINLGVALEEKGDVDGAVACYREAVRLDPKDARAHANLGALLCGVKRDYDGAVACFREAVRLGLKDARAHTFLGVALAGKKDYDGALAAHREAVRLDPEDAGARYNLGHALNRKGNLDGAIASYREAIRLNPGYPEALCNLGLALQRQGKLAEAVAMLRRGHELGSRRPDWAYPSAQWVQECERLLVTRTATVGPPPREVKP